MFTYVATGGLNAVGCSVTNKTIFIRTEFKEGDIAYESRLARRNIISYYEIRKRIKMNLIKILSTEANPIGEVQGVEKIDNMVAALANTWDENKLNLEKSSWWMFWKSSRMGMVAVTNFLLVSLDNLVNYIDDKLESGPDKKATVLASIEKLYDHVIREAMPIWLKPFSPAVKNLIVNVVMSSAIDFVVGKYRNGNWRIELEEAMEGIEKEGDSKE